MIKLFPTSLLVDANILIRSTFNQRPNHFLRLLSDRNIDLYSTMSIWQEAKKHLPEISRDRNKRMLQERLQERKKYIDLIQVVVYDEQNHLRLSAQARLPKRASHKKHSSNDWELIAVLLGFREPNCAILSNDKDFWGTGVPVWTLDRIKSYLDGFRPCT